MQSALHRNWKRVARVVALAGSLALAFAFTPGVTADSGSIRVRFGGDLAETRVVIDLDRAATGRLLSTEAGDQSVVLLLQRVEATTDQSGSGRGLVNSWSLRRELTGVRFQLDLNRTASVRRRFLLPPADGVSGYRYVIDLAAAGGTEARPGTMRAELTPVRSPPQPAAAESTGATPQVRAALDDAAFSASLREALSAPPPRAPIRSSRERRVIVIDAGHGGRDPGAAGQDSHEKDLTLAAARELRRRLEQTGRYRVIMTRSTDTYLSLSERVRITRRANADLFISLHADALTDPSRRGASVYTLSERGGTRVTRVLGRNEWFLRPDTGVADRSVGRILLDLTQRSTRNRSADFAQLVVEHISDRTPLLARTHRDANYFVLLAPDVPAALVEMGFITNSEDERALNNPAHRAGLMTAIANAIDAFFAEETTLASR